MARRGKRRGRLAVLVLGWAFVVLGLAGLVLPILQGILFLLVGLFLLGRSSPRVRLVRMRLRRRHPEWAARFDEAEGRARRLARRVMGQGNRGREGDG